VRLVAPSTTTRQPSIAAPRNTTVTPRNAKAVPCPASTRSAMPTIDAPSHAAIPAGQSAPGRLQALPTSHPIARPPRNGQAVTAIPARETPTSCTLRPIPTNATTTRTSASAARSSGPAPARRVLLVTSAEVSERRRRACPERGARSSGAVGTFLEALQSRAFRLLESTAVFSNISIWILTLMSGFVMADLTSAPLLITLAAAITPLAALPSAVVSGAAADTRNPRSVLLLSKAILVASAAFLSLMAISGALTPATLLLGLAGVGLSLGTSSPSWWSTLADLVPARLFPVALSLDSFQWNIGQVIGPVIGGLILAAGEREAMFLACTVLTLPLLGFLAIWRGRDQGRLATSASGVGEKTLSAISAGWRYFYYTPELRAIAVRTMLFITPAVALGSLLPIVAREDLHATSLTYGLYLALGGVGALGASVILPRLHGRLHLDVLIAGATMLDAVAIAILAAFPVPPLAIPVLAISGATWAWVTTVLAIATRDSAPDWVRTRLLAIYFLVQEAPYAFGGIAFGVVATFLPVRMALALDAALFLPSILLIPRFGLPVIDRSAHQIVVQPPIAVGSHVHAEDGPVLVQIEYLLAEEDVDAFLEAAAALRFVRRRLGATQWGVFEDVTHHGRFIETFVVPSWDSYLRQRQHYTAEDAAAEARAFRLHRGKDDPRVMRYVHPDTVEAARARSSWRREMARLVAEPFLEEPAGEDTSGELRGSRAGGGPP